MKKTPLHYKHLSLNAKMVDFAGFEMPVQYSGITDEHNAVRSICGIFDISHMGEFIVSGKNAEDFLNYMTVNDVSTMDVGDAQYSVMCYDHGGIVDDLLIYKYDNRHYMLVVNAANRKKDFKWLVDHKPSDLHIRDISFEMGLIALQGPSSREVLQTVLNADLVNLQFYTFIIKEIFGAAITIARTGYTGELGFEIYVHNANISDVWDAIISTGKVTPCGLASRDILRMEMKYCLYGNDIDETTNPIAAGLGWICKIEKGNFIGKEALLEAKKENSLSLVSFEMIDLAVPRKGYPLMNTGNKIGFVTSGTQSPSLQKGIGLGYVQEGIHQFGTEIEVEIRDKLKQAVIVQPPFYKHGSLYL